MAGKRREGGKSKEVKKEYQEYEEDEDKKGKSERVTCPSEALKERRWEK